MSRWFRVVLVLRPKDFAPLLSGVVFLMVLLVSAVRSHQTDPQPIDALTYDYGEKKMDLVEVCESIPQPKDKPPIPFLVGKEMCYWVEKEVK